VTKVWHWSRLGHARTRLVSAVCRKEQRRQISTALIQP
jgi:hypothetical protein